MFDALIDTNLLLAGTNSVMVEEHSGHADQVFDGSSHQIENSVHEFDMMFDLAADNSEELQPLQVTQVISTPTWCAKIDYPDDTHYRKSTTEEDECLQTTTDIVFDGSLQRNKFDTQGQIVNMKFVVIGNSISHEILTSNFSGPT